MGDLTVQRTLGDITFGLPVDIEPLHTPFGYYTFLGVNKDAPREVIDNAYRRLAGKLHPDRKGGDPEKFKALQHVYEILSDDGKELGQEHSKRRHYDEVCSLDELFDGQIVSGKNRTKRFSEIALIQMEFERKFAEREYELSQRNPEFTRLKEQLKNAPDSKKPTIAKKLQRIVIEESGLSKEDIQKLEKKHKEMKEEYRRRQMDFARSFLENQELYFDKILDVYFIGEGLVTFGTDRYSSRIEFTGHEERGKVLELILGNNPYIIGFQKVHFKAEDANVVITDPNIEGIFHVINGSVDVNYETSTYGKVIRAQAPEVINHQGFVQKGDLFVPENFATGHWYQKKPALDIAVKNGSISLRLTSPRLSHGYGFLLNKEFEEIKSSNKLRDLDEFINSNNFYSINKIINKF